MSPDHGDRRAVIARAGPAGLTAAYELLDRTGIRPMVCEKTRTLGGIAPTVRHHGNRMDIGGHRFFSKSDRVMDWWVSFLPLERDATGDQVLTYQRKQRTLSTGGDGGPDPETEDRVMLLRSRRSGEIRGARSTSGSSLDRASPDPQEDTPRWRAAREAARGDEVRRPGGDPATVQAAPRPSTMGAATPRLARIATASLENLHRSAKRTVTPRARSTPARGPVRNRWAGILAAL